MWSSNSMRSLRCELGVLALVSALAGCGFQLRGSYEPPYQSMFVAAASTSQRVSQPCRQARKLRIL